MDKVVILDASHPFPPRNGNATALARAFHVSTRAMLRRFGNETGQSPLDFLQQARIDAAKRLLESADHTVTSAMEHVRYTDPASFRRLFATRVGMAPAAYRRLFRTL